MKAITITGYRRPHYMQEALESLKKNNTEGYTLFCGLEPGNQAVVDVCSSVDYIPTKIEVNHKILGVRDNPYHLLRKVFNLGATEVVYIEEDIILSPDTLDLCNWYFNLPDVNNHLCLNLYNHDSKSTLDPSDVLPGKGFSSLGIAMTKYQWDTFFSKLWHTHKSGWDFSFTQILEGGKIKNLSPAVSRTHHIGRFGGVHYRAAAHDKMYVHNHLNQDRGPFNYRVVE